MRIKQILWQNRRDFKAIFVCPHCGKTETDDTGYRALATKYPEGYQV